MPRPWIEAGALLAAAGFRLSPSSFHPTPKQRIAAMAAQARFALLTRLDGATKPIVFPDIDALARRIQRDRQLQGLELIDIDDLEIPGEDRPRQAVQIYTTDAGNDRDRMLGYAWLDGRASDALRLALRRNFIVMADEAADQSEAA